MLWHLQINTCNSFYCDQFTPNSANKPKMWTENWPGWYLFVITFSLQFLLFWYLHFNLLLMMVL